MKKITPFLWFDGKAEEAMEIAWAGEIVSKLSRLKEKKIRLVATQYRTASGPGSPAGQPGWGGGSDRILDSTVVKERRYFT